MRRILLASVLFPACAFADQIPATSRITDVTIYAIGARVVREVTFDAPAGMHDIVLDDLPFYLDGSNLRILAGAGTTVGAYALTADGIPTGKPHMSGVQKVAKDRVRALEEGERRALAAIDAINARIEAADAMAGFLRQIGTGEAGLAAATPQALQDMAEMVGTKTAEATNIRAAALFERRQAEADLAEVQADLAAARDAFNGLSDGGTTPTVLRVTLATETAGPGTLQVAYYVDQARWSPVYDVDLARKDGRMTVERGVVVLQETGEDWSSVALTLSTARPNEQTAPSWLPADLRRIEPEVQMEARAASDAMMAGAPAPAMEPEVVAAKTAMEMGVDFVGDTVTYRYGLPVTLSSGVEALRLSLGTIDLTPKMRAVAVPRHDRTAYLEATVTNTTEEILLPGEAMLLRDGTLVGTASLEAIAPGVEFTLSFGPIEGLRLSRTLPVRAEGETGILTTSNQIEETATLKVENKTAEAWDLRVLDSVPYSEQEDLEITYAADPEPTEARVDGQRGHLAWDFALPAGETREIRVDHTISWPEGMVLQ